MLIYNDLRTKIRRSFFVLQNFFRVTLYYDTGKNSPQNAFSCPKIWKIRGGGKFVGGNLNAVKTAKTW